MSSFKVYFLKNELQDFIGGYSKYNRSITKEEFTAFDNRIFEADFRVTNLDPSWGVLENTIPELENKIVRTPLVTVKKALARNLFKAPPLIIRGSFIFKRSGGNIWMDLHD